MTFNDPYRVHNGCTCNNTVAMARAALDGLPMPLCAVHDAATIKQRRADDHLTAVTNEAAQLTMLYRELRADAAAPPRCTCLSLAAGLSATLSGHELPPCAIHTTAAPTTTDSSPLNGAALPNKLAALLGINPDPNTPSAA